MSVAVLSAVKISKAFPVQEAVRSQSSSVQVLLGLDLELFENEILCVLGASGCGKTTALRMLCGLDTPDGGTITSSVPRPGPQVGYLSQMERLIPWRTILGNVALPLELRGVSRTTARQAAADALREIGLERFSLSFPSQVSGGMRQRALLARLFVAKPRLLLLDEPLSQLDIVGRRELAALVQTYVKQHRAGAIVVTHSVEEAVFLGDRIVTLSLSPASVFSEFRLTGDSPHAANLLDRSTAFDQVMRSLLSAIGSVPGTY